MFQFVDSNVEIEYHRKQRAVNIEIAHFDLSEAFIKSRPTFPHKRQNLAKLTDLYKKFAGEIGGREVNNK